MSLAIDLLTVSLDELPDTPSNSQNPEQLLLISTLQAEALSIWYDNDDIEPCFEHLLYEAEDDEEFCDLYIAAHCL